MIVFINRFNKFINNDLQHITIPKYHNFIKKNISSSSSLPVTSFFSKKIYQSFAEFKNCTTFASAIKQHGRLAQLVQSIWFTPRGSGVRIPQDPPQGSLFKASFFISDISSISEFESLLMCNQAFDYTFSCYHTFIRTGPAFRISNGPGTGVTVRGLP